MYSAALEKQSSSQTAHLNTSIINADGDGDEMHKDGGKQFAKWEGENYYFGALLQIAS